MKKFIPLPKYQSIEEDVAFVVEPEVKTGEMIKEIKKTNSLIQSVSLLDWYQNTRTFHIIYLDKEKNLTTEEVTKVRQQIITALQKKFDVKVK